jgi:maleate cis-trans isomerase
MRIGLIVPANNTTMEAELPLWLAPGTSLDVVRVSRPPGLLTLADVPAYVDRALASAQDAFSGGRVDAIAYGCTAAGFLAGPAEDRRIASRLAEICEVPAVTVARAMTDWLVARRLRAVALLTPYSDAVNTSLSAFVASVGVRTERLSSFHARTTEELGRITAEQVRERALEIVTDTCDGLFIGCTQLPTHAVLAELEARLGRPVGSSIQVAAEGLQVAMVGGRAA